MPVYRMGEIRVTFRDQKITLEQARAVVEEIGVAAVAAKPEKLAIEGRAGYVYKLYVAQNYEDAYVELFGNHPAVQKAERFVERGE